MFLLSSDGSVDEIITPTSRHASSDNICRIVRVNIFLAWENNVIREETAVVDPHMVGSLGRCSRNRITVKGEQSATLDPEQRLSDAVIELKIRQRNNVAEVKKVSCFVQFANIRRLSFLLRADEVVLIRRLEGEENAV